MSTPTPSPELLRGATRVGVVLGIVALLAIGWGLFSRIEARAELSKAAAAEQVIPVLATHPGSGGAGEKLVLPGTVQAYTDTPIYARTSGYLKRWLVDIGTPVKAGQLLAEIDTPEVDSQTRQAEADLKTAEANNQLAQLTADRWKGLRATDSVSQQDTDDKIGDAAAKKAALASAQANLQRLRELEGFKRIVAPVDGAITARNIDIGDLVDAGGSSGTSRELFHIAATHRLRVYVQVPENYASDMKAGLTATLRLRENPGTPITATLSHSAGAIDPVTHTLLAQLDVDNNKGLLLPGGYVEVQFALAPHANTLRVPANALILNATGLQVAVIDKDSKIAMVTIMPGRDFGKEIEVLSGLTADQQVVLNPPDSLTAGQPVRLMTDTSHGGKP